MPACEPVGLEFLDTASIVVRTEVNVSASPTQVWQILNDTDGWPSWFEGMKVATVTSDEWNGLGSTRFVGIGPLRVHEEIVVWEPECRWGFCATHVAWTAWIAKRLLEMVEITPEGSGSCLTYIGALDPTPMMRPFGGLLRKQLVKAWSTSLPRIDIVASREI